MSLPPVESIYFTVDSIKELKNANLDFKFSSPALVSRFLYELCWTMVRGDLPFQKCKVVLEAVEFSDCGPEGDIGSYFADVVTQMAQDVKWLVESALVPVRFFQEHCEGEFLWESEMTKIKAADLKSKEVRVNTRLLYQQTKFNLLQEESEGYAKLVTLLCQVPEASSKSASTATVGIIKVLECFELQPDKIVFLDLIPMFRKSHALQILGFKVQYHQRMEVTSPVPIGLYELAALLLKKDFIDVDSILNVDAPGWMMEEMEGDAISLWEPVFINVPWWYVAYNRMISQFLTERTKSKFVFAGPTKTAETLFKYIAPEQVTVQYGGLSGEGEHEFTTTDPTTKEFIKPTCKHTIELPIPEACQLVWEVRVVGWVISYGAEFVPSAEVGYTWIVRGLCKKAKELLMELK